MAELKQRGYDDGIKKQAAQLREEGRTLRQIADLLGVTVTTLVNWFRDAKAVEPSNASADVKAEEARSGKEWRRQAVGTEGSAAVAPFRRRVTIHDVAEKSGVAVSTVSNFLNNKVTVAAKTRIRIQAAIDELHFTPNGLMRAIREGRTRILGILTYSPEFDEDTRSSITQPMMAGIGESMGAAEHDLLYYLDWRRRDLDRSLPFLDGHIDGLLFVGPGLNDPILERIAAAGLPTVVLLSRHVPPNVGFVNTDNIGAMSMIVDHLAAIGKRRIGFVGPDHQSNYLDRYNGIRDALGAKQLARDAIVKRYTLTYKSWTEDENRQARANRDFIELADQLDAIVCPDDWWALWMAAALRERGIRVPDDIAVVGFDDVALAAAGGLTTIRQPLRRIGQVAVQKLLAMIEGVPASECQVTLPGELIVRSSTVVEHN